MGGVRGGFYLGVGLGSQLEGSVIIDHSIIDLGVLEID